MSVGDFTWIGGNNGDLGVAENWVRTDNNPTNDAPRAPSLFDTAVINGAGQNIIGFLLPSFLSLNGVLTLDGVSITQAHGLFGPGSISIAGNLILDGIANVTADDAINVASGTDIAMKFGSFLTERNGDLNFTGASDFNVDGGSVVSISGAITVDTFSTMEIANVSQVES